MRRLGPWVTLTHVRVLKEDDVEEEDWENERNVEEDDCDGGGHGEEED